MRYHDTRLKQGLIAGLVVVGVIACLPIFAASVFLLRFALVGLVAVAVVGAVALYALSPVFRQRVEMLLEPEIRYKGLRQATDVALDPAHVWARVEPEDAFVGADDVALSTLGPVTEVELPPVGSHVRRGERLFTLRRGLRRLELPAPFDATVLAGNESLLDSPDALNREPFGSGWVVRVAPDSPWRARRSLLRGLEARAWFQQEVDRLMACLGAGEEAWSMADGGVVVDDLYRLIDDATWERLQRSYFVGGAGEVVDGDEEFEP